MIATVDLISPAYVALQHELHARPNGYGGKGDTWAEAVLALVDQIGASSVLDYGCGQGALKRALVARKPAHVRVDEYDPAIPGKDGPPLFADLIVCTDVLEHVEPERLENVIAHLRALAKRAVFAVIALRPSNKMLADGRNAHLIVESADWWIARLSEGFVVARGPVNARKPEAREVSLLLTHRSHPCG